LWPYGPEIEVPTAYTEDGRLHTLNAERQAGKLQKAIIKI